MGPCISRYIYTYIFFLCDSYLAWIGLEYLRNGCKPAIVLRDLKSSNILFNDLEAKISDIGMSTYLESGSFLSTAPVGTSSYLDPE